MENQIIKSVKVDDKIISLQKDMEIAKNKLLQVSFVKKKFPNAIYGIMANGKTGFKDSSINEKTQGAKKEYFYSASKCRYAYCFVLTVKKPYGDVKISNTEETYMDHIDVLNLLNNTKKKQELISNNSFTSITLKDDK